MLYLAETDAGNIAGFGSFSVFDLARQEVLYCHSVVFAKEHQRRGLMGTILDRAIKDHPCHFLAARTQNPVIYVAFARRCQRIYPNGKEIPPEPFVTIAAAIAERLHMKGFSIKTFIEAGTYHRCLTGDPPHYGGSDQSIANVLAGLGLVAEHGDAAIVVGELPIRS